MQRNAPQRSGVNSPRLFNVFDYSGARVRHRSNQTRPTRIHTYGPVFTDRVHEPFDTRVYGPCWLSVFCK